MIVIAIIGILASIVLVSLSNAREKAQLAAFKGEAAGAVAGLLLQCDTIASITLPNDTNTTSWGSITQQSCGPSGSGTFTVSARPVNTGITCTASVTDTGATFAGADC